jgi:superfamily II DNA or RNA helicase
MSAGSPVDLMHGDNIEPWAAGGLTVPENLQALCGSCNLRKGARPRSILQQYFDLSRCEPGRAPLRRWQAAALDAVLQGLGTGPVLVEACPGAGKTNLGLTVAYRLLELKQISRLLVIAPTLGIVGGWLRAASGANPNSPTIPLRDPARWRAYNPIGEGWLGAVLTYQSLFAMTDMFLAHATDSGHRTLVIFDEVHHASVESGWGRAAQTAFSEAATAILSLSGTPFRTDNDPIAFVPASGGAAKPHYRYSYASAIADKACRPVQFVEVRGRTTFRTEDGEIEEVSFDDTDVPDVTVQQRLRAALEWIEPGSIADKMLQDANAYVIGLRASGDGDAAGLVVCVDCEHADSVASHMSKHLLGRRPVVACSRTYDANDPDPARAIEQFERSHDPWIVAVNMISEGVDIRRLRVVVYLTNRMTLMSFRQIVGRVVRSDANNRDDSGRVYIPADSRLLQMARAIKDEVEALPPRIVIDTEPRIGVGTRPRGEAATIEVLGTSADQGGAFDTSGNLAEATLVAKARRFIAINGLTGTDAESLALLARHKEKLLAQLLAVDHGD